MEIAATDVGISNVILKTKRFNMGHFFKAERDVRAECRAKKRFLFRGRASDHFYCFASIEGNGLLPAYEPRHSARPADRSARYR